MDMGGSIFLLVAAPFVGSFLGVLVERLPVGRPVVMGRSMKWSMAFLIKTVQRYNLKRV